MARRMETRHCAVCGKPFQASVEGHRTKCDEHKGSRTRRDALQGRKRDAAAAAGQRCTIPGCGRPAVVTFRGSDGRTYAECAQHAPASRR